MGCSRDVLRGGLGCGDGTSHHGPMGVPLGTRWDVLCNGTCMGLVAWADNGMRWDVIFLHFSPELLLQCCTAFPVTAVIFKVQIQVVTRHGAGQARALHLHACPRQQQAWACMASMQGQLAGPGRPAPQLLSGCSAHMSYQPHCAILHSSHLITTVTHELQPTSRQI